MDGRDIYKECKIIRLSQSQYHHFHRILNFCLGILYGISTIFSNFPFSLLKKKKLLSEYSFSTFRYSEGLFLGLTKIKKKDCLLRLFDQSSLCSLIFALHNQRMRALFDQSSLCSLIFALNNKRMRALFDQLLVS